MSRLGLFATSIAALVAATATIQITAADAGSAVNWERDQQVATRAWKFAAKAWPNQYAGIWTLPRGRFRGNFVFAFTRNGARHVKVLRKRFPTRDARYLAVRRAFSQRFLDGLAGQLITDRERIRRGHLSPPGQRPGEFDLDLDVRRNRVVLTRPHFARGYRAWFRDRYGAALVFETGPTFIPLAAG